MALAGTETVEGKKQLMKSTEGRALLDLVIKDTYRTGITRAMQGCCVSLLIQRRHLICATVLFNLAKDMQLGLQKVS
jgi:hypothetical protein